MSRARRSVSSRLWRPALSSLMLCKNWLNCSYESCALKCVRKGARGVQRSEHRRIKGRAGVARVVLCSLVRQLCARRCCGRTSKPFCTACMYVDINTSSIRSVRILACLVCALRPTPSLTWLAGRILYRQPSGGSPRRLHRRRPPCACRALQPQTAAAWPQRTWAARTCWGSRVWLQACLPHSDTG